MDHVYNRLQKLQVSSEISGPSGYVPAESNSENDNYNPWDDWDLNLSSYANRDKSEQDNISWNSWICEFLQNHPDRPRLTEEQLMSLPPRGPYRLLCSSVNSDYDFWIPEMEASTSTSPFSSRSSEMETPSPTSPFTYFRSSSSPEVKTTSEQNWAGRSDTS